MAVLVQHDAGCRHARPDNGGHTDAAKRLADTYTLHRIAGARTGVIAVALADGRSDGVVYHDRAAAVAHQHHNERRFAYIHLGAPSMTVCEAESVMRWQRQAAALAPADRDAKRGGLQVIPRLTIEGREHQLSAMRHGGLPVALGYAKE